LIEFLSNKPHSTSMYSARLVLRYQTCSWNEWSQTKE